MKEEQEDNADNSTMARKNWLEWAVFGISALLVAGVMVYVIYDGWTSNGDPPRIQVTLGRAEQQGPVYVVPVTVMNTGSMTAQSVSVEVELETTGGEKELATLDLDYLPREGSRSGWVSFRSDPGSARTVRAQAVSYQEP